MRLFALEGLLLSSFEGEVVGEESLSSPGAKALTTGPFDAGGLRESSERNCSAVCCEIQRGQQAFQEKESSVADLGIEIVGRFELVLDLLELGAKRLDRLLLLFKASAVPAWRRK